MLQRSRGLPATEAATRIGSAKRIATERATAVLESAMPEGWVWPWRELAAPWAEDQKLAAHAALIVPRRRGPSRPNSSEYANRMFTGIVREVGSVVSFDGARLVLEAAETAESAAVGDSVAVAGVCLTVVAAGDGTLSFDVVPETLGRTALNALEPGSSVNLEPSLRIGDQLGGHVVQGHVDAVGRVRSVTPEGAGRRIWVEAPEAVLGYCIEKGSIALDGVSLTIASFDDDGFEVALIPHTLEATTLGLLEPGDEVNLEADVLGKVVERLVAARLP